MSEAKKSVAQSPSRNISENPLFKLSNGQPVESTLPEHRTSGANGNLFFEYVQNVASLRGKVRSGDQVAEFLESYDMIAVDWKDKRYVWKQEPITKSEFLKLVTPPLKSVE